MPDGISMAIMDADPLEHKARLQDLGIFKVGDQFLAQDSTPNISLQVLANNGVLTERKLTLEVNSDLTHHLFFLRLWMRIDYVALSRSDRIQFGLVWSSSYKSLF
ncbi:hypothetical protein STEG23_023196 [Scotinomys teguina]